MQAVEPALGSAAKAPIIIESLCQRHDLIWWFFKSK
jgi:hypothetical protein